MKVCNPEFSIKENSGFSINSNSFLIFSVLSYELKLQICDFTISEV
jgi:hypothetical protein